MSTIVRAPDTDGIWREKLVSSAGGARGFDALPVPVAAWWPGWQVLSSYGAALLQCVNADASPSVSPGPGALGEVLASAIAAPGALQSQYASQLLDQSGNAWALTAAGVAAAPKVYDQGSLRFTQQLLSLALEFGAANTLTRGDALGLAADPALTIAWKARWATVVAPDAPNLLALGDAVAPELCLFAYVDAVALSDFSGLSGGTWMLLGGAQTDALHSYVLTKPAGTGYDASSWRLYLDGADQGAPTVGALGPLTLGAALTQLGNVPGGAFPFVGTLGGVAVWDSVLGLGDLATLQAFLDSV
jgi:hypothetical protein